MYLVLPLRAKVDPGAIVIKGYSAFPKAPVIRLFNVIYKTLVGGGFLPLCREAVGVFYSPSRQGNDRKQRLGKYMHTYILLLLLIIIIFLIHDWWSKSAFYIFVCWYQKPLVLITFKGSFCDRPAKFSIENPV